MKRQVNYFQFSIFLYTLAIFSYHSLCLLNNNILGNEMIVKIELKKKQQ